MRFFPAPETVRAYLEALNGYERFLITAGAGAVDGILLWHGKLADASYVTLTLGTVGAYLAAAAVTRVANIKAGNGDGKGAPPTKSD